MSQSTRPAPRSVALAPSGGADRRDGVEVRLDALRKTFGKTVALDDLSLTLDAGELVALLGPSGCGKTTALRVLAGLDEADRGKVLVDGRDLSDVPANRRDMGMVFQAYSLFPHMSVQANVEFGLRMRKVGSRARRDRSLQMLELVGLAAQAKRYAHQLSGGQQQRVALARALAIEPSVLLLDEPLSALDAKVRTQLREEIRRVQLEVGTTTLFVTHDQEEALSMADRVGVMRSGRLEQIAAPHELYAQPASGFVADFVGLSNRIPGRVIDGHVEIFGAHLPILEGSAGAGTGSALVRPESIRLYPDGDGDGVVVLVGFLGPVTRVTARVGDQDVIAQLPSSAAAALEPGVRVRTEVDQTPVLVVAD